MVGGIGFVLCLIAVVFAQHATAQTLHTVGDTTGWTSSAGTTFYSDWAARNNFVLGDSLQFNFATNAHDVLEVSKESFDACSFNVADNDIKKTGPVTEVLDDVGMHYFVCTIGQHCLAGQKLSVNVSNIGGPMSPSSPRPPSSLPPPPPSSSNAVMASLYLTLSAIVMSLF